MQIEVELLLVPVPLFTVPFPLVAIDDMGRSPEVDHVGREWMAVNPHRLLGIFELDAPLLNGCLDLLPEDFALVGVVGW